MKRLLPLLLIGCSVSSRPSEPERKPTMVFELRAESEYGTIVYRFHDEQLNVTCWILGGETGGIHCLPDAETNSGMGRWGR